MILGTISQHIITRRDRVKKADYFIAPLGGMGGKLKSSSHTVRFLKITPRAFPGSRVVFRDDNFSGDGVENSKYEPTGKILSDNSR